MATERSQHQRWYEDQLSILLDLGYDLVDAEARLTWVLDNLPANEDPATYIFPPAQLWQEPSTPENVQDSRTAWVASDDIAPKWKRLLDAKEEDV